MSVEKQFKKLNKQLYPTGRAFEIPEGSVREKLDHGLMASEIRMHGTITGILDEILPDNANFTAEMATAWEQRLGLITNSAVSLDDRKAAIIRKMNHPGDIAARQSWDYLEQSLQLAGFDVYVHDNTTQMNVYQFLQPTSETGQQGDGQQGDFQQGSIYSAFPSVFQVVQQGSVQQGDFQQGAPVYADKIINHIDWTLDQYHNITDFFVLILCGDLCTHLCC